MKNLICIVIFLTSLEGLSFEFSSKYKYIETIMNRSPLLESDIKTMESVLKFNDDRLFLSKVKERKSIFGVSEWHVFSAFDFLYLMKGNRLVVKMEFKDKVGEAIINGQKLFVSSNKSIVSQVRQFMGRSKGASLWNFLNEFAQAAPENLTYEERFLVTSMILDHKSLINAQFKDSYDRTARDINLSKINDVEFSSTEPLSCNKKSVSGKVNLTVMGINLPFEFNTKFKGKGENTKLVIDSKLTNGRSPITREVRLEGASQNFELACFVDQFQIKNGSFNLNPDSAIDDERKEEVQGFINSLNNTLASGAPDSDIVMKACYSRTREVKLKASDLRWCLKKLCKSHKNSNQGTSGKYAPYVSSGYTLDTLAFDQILNDQKIKFLGLQIQKKDSVPNREIIDLINKSKENMDSKFAKLLIKMQQANISIPETCKASGVACELSQELIKDDELRVAVATYNASHNSYTNQITPFTYAIEKMFELIEASVSCCLSQRCTDDYNTMFKTKIEEVKRSLNGDK